MLGYYKWTQSKDEREKIDTKIKLQYENKLSDWMGIEAIVRQKDRETTAANIARLSGNTPGKTFEIVTVMTLASGLGGLKNTRNLGFQLTVFQPRGVDYAHHITACPPGFENLTTYLN